MPSTVARPTSSYTELAAIIRESGLMRRTYLYYWSLMVASLASFAGIVAGVVLLEDSWWTLLLAVALGVVVTQFGFLGHEASHRQVFASCSWNEWSARILSGGFAGLSYGWWKDKHNRHHATPNQEGKDPDIGPGALAFTAEIAARRTEGFAGWFLKRQGWLFFPLLTLEGLNLHYAGVRVLVQRRSVKHRWVELTLVLTRLVGYVVFLALVLPPGLAVAFFALQMAVFGLCLGASFAPSHKGMPIIPKDSRIEFLHRQVLTSRNVRGNPLLDLAMGGLNYQIEHHLFPSMPRPNLRRAQPIVRQYCADRGVPYAEAGLLESYGIVVDYLNHVGLRARGPFDCPLAADLRTTAGAARTTTA